MHLIRASLAVLLLLSLGTKSFPQTEEAVNEKGAREAGFSDSDWPLQNRTPDNQRHSPLAMITGDGGNASKLRSLQEYWQVTLPDLVAATWRNSGIVGVVRTSMQATPVVHDGVMYVSTWNDLYAIDIRKALVSKEADLSALMSAYQIAGLKSCGTVAELPCPPPLLWWRRLGTRIQRMCCSKTNRGAALGFIRLRGKRKYVVYIASPDARLMAFDARTGLPLAGFGPRGNGIVSIASGLPEYSNTAPPIVYDNEVLVGIAGSEFGVRGFLTAYDAATGECRWRFYTVPPTKPVTVKSGKQVPPVPANSDRWSCLGKVRQPIKDLESSYISGGGAPWGTPAIDEYDRQVIVGTGNPYPDYVDDAARKGANCCSSSLIAVDLRTGTENWHTQLVRHDLWDYDAASSPPVVVAFDKRVLVAVASKVGVLYVLNAKDGSYVLPTDTIVDVDSGNHQDVPTSTTYVPFSTTRFSKPTTEGVCISPGAFGGTDWASMAFFPTVNDRGAQQATFYIPALFWPTYYRTTSEGHWAGTNCPFNQNVQSFSYANFVLAAPVGSFRSDAWKQFSTVHSCGFYTSVLLEGSFNKRLSAKVGGEQGDTHTILHDCPSTLHEAGSMAVDINNAVHPQRTGLITTDGNLVIGGTVDGKLEIYGLDLHLYRAGCIDAFTFNSRSEVVSSAQGTHCPFRGTDPHKEVVPVFYTMLSHPITYALDGRQYITGIAEIGGQPSYSQKPAEETVEAEPSQLWKTANWPPDQSSSFTVFAISCAACTK